LRSSAKFWNKKFFKISPNSHIGKQKSLNFTKYSRLLLTTYLKKHQTWTYERLTRMFTSAYLQVSIVW
jgi:hypothetical protein